MYCGCGCCQLARIAHAINSVETGKKVKDRVGSARIAHAINSVETVTAVAPSGSRGRVLRMLLIALKHGWE